MEDYSLLEKEVIENLFVEFPWLINLDYEYYATLRFAVLDNNESIVVLKNIYNHHYTLLYIHFGVLKESHKDYIQQVKTIGMNEWSNYDRHRQPSLIVIAEHYPPEIEAIFEDIELMAYGPKIDDLLTSKKTVFSFFED